MKRNLLKDPFRLLSTFLLIVICSVLLSSCEASSENKAKAESLVKDAQSAAQDSRFSDAIKKYDEARLLDSQNPDIYVGVSSIYIKKNRLGDSRKFLNSAPKEIKDNAKILAAQGNVEFLDKKYDKAESYLENALRQNKSDYDAKYLLALTYENENEFQKALNLLNLPDSAGDTFIKSKILKTALLKDNVTAAREELALAKAVTTTDATLTATLDRYDKALVRTTQIPTVEQSPKYTAAILASEMLSAGYEDAALDMLKDFKTEEDYWEAVLYLGWGNLMNGNYDDANQYLTKASLINPADYVSQQLLCRTFYNQQNFSSMASACDRAVLLAPAANKTTLMLEYANLLEEVKRITEADTQYKALIKTDKANTSKYTIKRIELLLKQNLVNDAKTLAATIQSTTLPTALIPEYDWVMAWISLEEENTNQATTWINDAISKSKLEPKYRLLLGKIYFQAGKNQEAKKALEKAVDLDLQGSVTAEAIQLLDRI